MRSGDRARHRRHRHDGGARAAEHDAFAGPAVLTVADLEAAAEFAAADAAELDAQWEALDEAARDEQLRWADDDGEGGAGRGETDPEGERQRSESDYLRSLLTDANLADAPSPAAWLSIAAASPGAMGVPPTFGDPGDGLAQLEIIDRLAAWVASRRYQVLAALAPELDPSAYRAEQHVVDEIALATRTGEGAARFLVDVARQLSGPLLEHSHALAAGQISDGHVRALVRGTARVGDDAVVADPVSGQVLAGRSREDKLAAIAHRVKDRACRETVGQFERTVLAAVCAVDPEGEADRRAAAVAARDVCHYRDSDGMGVLVNRDDGARLAAIHARLTSHARQLQRERGGLAAVRAGEADARIGACRSDVLAALVLGTEPARAPADEGDPDPTGIDRELLEERSDVDDFGDGQHLLPADAVSLTRTLEPVRASYEGHLVIDLPTLQGLVDHPCLLDGSPVPAPVGRELARSVAAWRRFVTSPVTGHLLDYGDRTYLPGPLVKFIRARDGQCTAPYCQRPASGCEVDHRDPWPDGPSSASNCGLLCARHHPLKTAGHLQIRDGSADGAMTYVSGWGQAVPCRPRAVVDSPRPDPPSHVAERSDPACGRS